MRRMLTLGALLALLVLPACSAEGFSSQGADSARVEDMDAEAAAGGGDAGDAPQGDGEEAADQESVGDGQSSLPEAPASAAGDRVIKEGTITIEVDAGEFDRAFAAVVAAARRQGGDVVASDTSTADDGTTSGTVTVRVPVRAYEDLLVGVGSIGTVRGRALDAEDVTTEFVDLESRLRHLQAQERFYLGLLDEAESVEDAIAVQQRLESLQGDIEQVRGRLRYLDDRTSFSTLTVELFETGATPLVADDPAARPTLARYWETAQDAFINVLGITLVVLVFVAPLLALVAVGVVAWRLIVTRRSVAPAPPPQAPLPPASEDEVAAPRG